MTFFPKKPKWYNTLAVIKKLKNLAPLHVRKRLTENLVFSLIDYNDIVCHPILKYLRQGLQRIQLVAASFVYNHYADMSDVLKLGWLPISYRRDYHITRTICKAVYQNCWPTCLKLVGHKPARALRSSCERRLEPSSVPGTLQNSAAMPFNSLLQDIKNCTELKVFDSKCRNHFKTLATSSS